MFLICVVVILYSAYSSSKRMGYLDSDYGYTVGKTLKYEFADGWKDCVQYKYYVNKVKYVSCKTIDH